MGDGHARDGVDRATRPAAPSGPRPKPITHHPSPVTLRLPPIVRAMRPLQWTKNALVFAALVFADKLFEAEAAARSLVAFACFCAVSSAIYLINDLKDVDADRHHPTKRFRPIAAGLVAPGFAFAVALVLLTLALI